jgi:hypothetical protein
MSAGVPAGKKGIACLRAVFLSVETAYNPLYPVVIKENMLIFYLL